MATRSWFAPGLRPMPGAPRPTIAADLAGRALLPMLLLSACGGSGGGGAAEAEIVEPLGLPADLERQFQPLATSLAAISSSAFTSAEWSI